MEIQMITLAQQGPRRMSLMNYMAKSKDLILEVLLEMKIVEV